MREDPHIGPHQECRFRRPMGVRGAPSFRDFTGVNLRLPVSKVSGDDRILSLFPPAAKDTCRVPNILAARHAGRMSLAAFKLAVRSLSNEELAELIEGIRVRSAPRNDVTAAQG